MIFLIILFPFLGFLSGILFGRFLGKGVKIITTLSTLCSFLLSLFFLFKIIRTGNTYILTVNSWIYVDSLNIAWKFCFDSLTVVMLVVVTFISFLVHLYSTEYMEHDPHLMRFMSYLSLFTFFMLLLVTGNNFLQMFVGWEGVGVSSYLLINFWFTRIQANKASIKAMLVNRVGDFALLIAIFSIYFIYNSLDYDIVFTLIPLMTEINITLGNIQFSSVDFICFFLFIGAMGKSAQIGLHTWLPDAMEGPTPVSALIHAATMVTAGVFLINRCSYLFEYSPFVLKIIVFIGSSTAFFASTTGLFQNDMKKVIAYSTCSQLGYMVFACGLSSYEVGMFHLYNHAFFKALLFLGAGSVIHALSDEQDMRKMGGLQKILPFSYGITLVGSLALIGFPFLAGFYSKDVILELSFACYQNFGLYSYILGTFGAFFTAFYSTRLIYLVFLAKPNSSKNIALSAHEGSTSMSIPLLLLSILSIFIGFLSKDLFIGFGTDFWGASVFVKPTNYLLCDIEFIDIKYKLLPLSVTILGVFLSYFLYSMELHRYYNVKKTILFKYIYFFFNKKWYFDRLYNEMIVQKSLDLSYHFFYKIIDRGIVELIGPFGIVNTLINFYSMVKKYQTGFILTYLSYFIISIFFLIMFSVKNILLIILLLIIMGSIEFTKSNLSN